MLIVCQFIDCYDIIVGFCDFFLIFFEIKKIRIKQINLKYSQKKFIQISNLQSITWKHYTYHSKYIYRFC